MEIEPIIRVGCDCGHAGHFFAIYPWEIGSMVAVVCEADRHLPFLSRLKHAAKYLFGKSHLNYIEVILDRDITIKNIQDALLQS